MSFPTNGHTVMQNFHLVIAHGYLAKQSVLHASHKPRSLNIIKSSPHTIDNNVKLVSAYLHVLLVINAHDNEMNPGPHKLKFPCQMC